MKAAGRMQTTVALAGLALAALLSNTVLFRQSVQGNTDLTRSLPQQLGSWVMIDEVAASPGEIRGLETRDIVKRSYSDGRHHIQLVVAYISHSSRKSAHAQEACLRGSGALVGSIHSTRMSRNPVHAKVISMDLHGRKDWVYYWYKMGNAHSADYLMSSLRMFLRGLWGKEAGGTTLVRLLTTEGRGDSQALIAQRMEDFTHWLLPELQKTLP